MTRKLTRKLLIAITLALVTLPAAAGFFTPVDVKKIAVEPSGACDQDIYPAGQAFVALDSGKTCLCPAGTWVCENYGAGGGSAPGAGSYLTRVADANLSNEFAVGGLATGFLINTVTTGVPTVYAGTGAAPANQWLTALSVTGAPTTSQPAFTNISGSVTDAQVPNTITVDLATLATTATALAVTPVQCTGALVANGVDANGDANCVAVAGTGTVTAVPGALTVSRLMVGNDGVDSKVLGSLGTVTQTLHGNAAGLPTWGAVDLATAQVTGVLPNTATTGTPAATGSTLVARDVDGDFSARIGTFEAIVVLDGDDLERRNDFAENSGDVEVPPEEQDPTHVSFYFTWMGRESGTAEPKYESDIDGTTWFVTGNRCTIAAGADQIPVASAVPGKVVLVIDGSVAHDCAVGGGTHYTFCASDGVVWTAIGG
jgi:hypothetical protein